MKYLKNKITLLIIIIGSVLIATILHVYKIDFPCLNSDEASFSYNAYSILKTGRDEYGKFMPTRFLAFGENKLPVTIYSIVPSLFIFGLNDLSARLPFILLGVLSPIIFYFLTKKITGNRTISVLAGFLASISPWIQILSRHIHEDTIMLFLGSLTLLFLAKLQDRFEKKYIWILTIISLLGLFTYHTGKFLAAFIILWVLIICLKKKVPKISASKSILIILIPIFIFGITEYLNPSTRISNLFFTSNQGFKLSIESLRNEHNSRIIHNKLNQSVLVLTNQYLSYFSPEFLVTNGDSNLRFGQKGISPITPVEFLFIFVGIYFLFKDRNKYRFLILSFFLTSPLTASVSWQTDSLSRSYLMIIPILVLVAYGFFRTTQEIKNQQIGKVFIFLFLGVYLYFSFFPWDMYFNHYTKSDKVSTAWQCGYKEINTIINNKYSEVDKIYITKKLGQPYIFSLFYLKYPPAKYQKQANLSPLDEYGFGQVEKFDKFDFNFPDVKSVKNKSLVIGYPEEFSNLNLDMSHIWKIEENGKEVFWIYEIK